ncbi:MAG TPA: SRPBCC family protein [Oligoflexus sp.]|uniref:SRPBCC family protein n=1 Tax=Oligoflexus sp. TaxID=1971216 RepID=UPI002D7F50CE|nr:SRPBCC family protein [Oligoflexus sp.]HET9241761.1 SRPBCC family protein [Oligoflexus sp.]
MLKKIGLVLVAVAFAILAFPNVLPHAVEMERRITIQSPPAAVYAVLADFHQYRSWDPFSANDPESTSRVEGQGLGSIYAWEGEKIGRGKMVMKDLQENARVDVLLTFEKPFPSQAHSAWIVNALDNGDTEVVWQLQQDLSYFQRYMGLIMDGVVGGNFETGLARLKAKVEVKPL